MSVENVFVENIFQPPPSLSAAVKTLEEVREWLGGETRWRLWSATGRTPSPMLSGDDDLDDNDDDDDDGEDDYDDSNRKDSVR